MKFYKITRAIFVDTFDGGSGGDLMELVTLCECETVDEGLVFVFEFAVLSRLASISALAFCFIASVGSTYHL